MKLRVERDGLADAVAWTAKSLPSRPSVPVLAGVMLRVADNRLTVSGFDYEVSSQVSTEVQADAGAFAAAVAQVAVAAGRDDTLTLLTGVRVELEGSTMTLLATDRYRLAIKELQWRPEVTDASLQALVPAKILG